MSDIGPAPKRVVDVVHGLSERATESWGFTLRTTVVVAALAGFLFVVCAGIAYVASRLDAVGWAMVPVAVAGTWTVARLTARFGRKDTPPTRSAAMPLDGNTGGGSRNGDARRQPHELKTGQPPATVSQCAPNHAGDEDARRQAVDDQEDRGVGGTPPSPRVPVR